MSESRKQAAAQLKQNKMASAFEQLSAGCKIDPLGTQTLNPFPNLIGARGTQPGGISQRNYLGEGSSLFRNLGSIDKELNLESTQAPGNLGIDQTPEDADNIVKLKQLLDRVNQKREIIMKQLMNPKNQSDTRKTNLGGLYNIPEESGVSISANPGKLNRRPHVNFADNCEYANDDLVRNNGNRFDSNEVEKEFERILLHQTAQQMVSREIQVSPRMNECGLSQALEGDSMNQPMLNSKSDQTVKMPAARMKVQTAVWTHLENENDPFSIPDDTNNTEKISDEINRIDGRIIMYSQEVQTSMEFIGPETNPQVVEEPHNVSTWAEDLQASNQSPSRPQKNTIAHQGSGSQQHRSPNAQRQPKFQTTDASSNAQYNSPNAHIRQKISQQSKITTIKAAKNTATSESAQNQYVCQVETTSSTTEIEVSSLEPVYEDRRSRRKKHRSGRKSTVAFPPSPIAKIKQVRKTLFNDNIEVIVNIKDDLLSNIVRGELDDGKSNRGAEQSSRQDVQHGKNGHEGRSYRQRCSYYPDENRPCAQNCPCSSRSRNWQRCKGQCQSQRCHCVPECEENSTDETKSSYMSPPRYIKTLHEKEINNLISQHSLHGKLMSQQNLVHELNKEGFVQHGNLPAQENVKRRNQMKGPEYFEPHENRRNENVQRGYEENYPDRTVESKLNKPIRGNHKGPANLESGINKETLELINEKMNHAEEENCQGRQFNNQANKGKRKDKKEKQVESVAQNNELMNYIVTLLNMDKKDIEGIPIEVSDVSIASELFTSASEQSEPSGNDNIKQHGKGLDKPADVHTKAETYDRTTHNIDVNSKRNRNILAQKYTDIVHQRAGKICSNLNPTGLAENSRFEEYRPDENYKPEEYVPVKHPCNTRVCQPTTKSTLENVLHKTTPDMPGCSTLAQSIASAGSKVPYKEIFKSNLEEGAVYQSKLEAIAPLLNCKEPPYRETLERNSRPPFDNILRNKFEANDKPDGNYRQTNFDIQPPGPKKAPARFDPTGAGRQHKHIRSPSRVGREQHRGRHEKTTAIQGKSPSKYPAKRHRSTAEQRTQGPLNKDPFNEETNNPHQQQNKPYNEHLKPPHNQQSTKQNINTSIQTTVQSGDESTVYLNIPRRFENVDNVGVQERTDQSLDTSDLIGKLNQIDKSGRYLKDGLDPLDCRKWKVVKDICAGAKVSLAERRRAVKDICAGVGVRIGERGANVADIERALFDGFKGNDDAGRKGEDRLDGSMDLQVPDVCLEHPLSQQNSGR